MTKAIFAFSAASLLGLGGFLLGGPGEPATAAAVPAAMSCCCGESCGCDDCGCGGGGCAACEECAGAACCSEACAECCDEGCAECCGEGCGECCAPAAGCDGGACCGG